MADDAALLEEVKEVFAREDYSAVLEKVKPVLAKGDGAAPEQAKLAREIAAAAHQRRGEDHFRNGRIAESIADFDAVIALFPEEEPGHWQRGIAYYYAGEYEKGVRQFERHQTVNPEDVENAVWHLLCLARVPGQTLESAREKFMPVTRDRRIPMFQIHRLYGGKGTEEEVVEAAASAAENAHFYQDLYLGLYHELTGDQEKSMTYIARAASNPAANHYMGDVARTHLVVRGREDASGN
jgi:lipoprotein NlpI